MSRGDHLFVWRLDCLVPYQHHAIDLGDGDVIHFTGEDGTTARPWEANSHRRVRRTSMHRLTRGGRDRLHLVREATPDAAADVVERAVSQLDRPDYCVVFRNCEHFAHWASTGVWASRQIDVAAERTSSLVTKVALRIGHHVLRRGPSCRLHPAALAGDVMQFATESIGQHVGIRNADHRKRIGRGVGLAATLGVGAVGGPAGMLAAGGYWAAGELSGMGCRAALAKVTRAVEPAN